MIRPTRPRFIPSASQKVTDKVTGAVAYLYDNSRRHPSVCAYLPKAVRPSLHVAYRTQEGREKAVTAWFAGLRASHAAKASARAEDAAWKHDYKVGDVLMSMWGYDQTNVDWYEVTDTSAAMVTIRKIAAHDVRTADDSGRTAPQPGVYVGEAMRKKPSRHGVRLTSYSTAHKAEFQEVGGMRIYGSASYSRTH